MIRVLFVCLGNICRSPMAEALFRHKVKAAGLADKIEIDSAGTGSYHIGRPPHPGTREILDEKGVSYVGQVARQIGRDDLQDFDYILTMDEDNLAGVLVLGQAKGIVRPLMAYAPHIGVLEVPDPYHTGGYPRVYELVDAACDGLLAAIRVEHNL